MPLNDYMNGLQLLLDKIFEHLNVVDTSSDQLLGMNLCILGTSCILQTSCSHIVLAGIRSVYPDSMEVWQFTVYAHIYLL